MAVVLEINLVCKKLVNLNQVLQNSQIRELNPSIERISIIDNWSWENQQELQSLSLTSEVLNENKIIVVNLKSSKLKSLGCYIEKISEMYVYNFWVNTEGYPELDADEITAQNKKIFKKIYQVIEEEIVNQKIEFQILGIGTETNFQYTGNWVEAIRNSQNIITWFINSNLEIVSLPSEYHQKMHLKQGFVVLSNLDVQHHRDSETIRNR